MLAARAARTPIMVWPTGMGGAVPIRPVFWMGSSRADLKSFPEPVQSNVGYALFAAQRGEEYRSVKNLQGFGGRAVLDDRRPV